MVTKEEQIRLLNKSISSFDKKELDNIFQNKLVGVWDYYEEICNDVCHCSIKNSSVSFILKNHRDMNPSITHMMDNGYLDTNTLVYILSELLGSHLDNPIKMKRAELILDWLMDKSPKTLIDYNYSTCPHRDKDLDINLLELCTDDYNIPEGREFRIRVFTKLVNIGCNPNTKDIFERVVLNLDSLDTVQLCINKGCVPTETLFFKILKDYRPYDNSNGQLVYRLPPITSRDTIERFLPEQINRWITEAYNIINLQMTQNFNIDINFRAEDGTTIFDQLLKYGWLKQDVYSVKNISSLFGLDDPLMVNILACVSDHMSHN